MSSDPRMSTGDSFNDSSQLNMAASFKSRNTALSAEQLRNARETRAQEALRMKDEQLRILAEQNAALHSSLDKVEEEANIIQMEKLSVEQENRTLRDNNFELQSKSRAAETQAKRMQTEVADKEKQLRISTDQNSELLRFLESEEAKAVQLQSEVHELRSELDELRQKHGSLLTTAKTHEEMSTKAAREGQLRAEEIRLLRAETEQLKQQNSELKMKTQVEVEALQEQLRVRKEKQYQLLEKLQGQEEAKRQAEDQVTGMEEQLRTLHARNVELETQLQFEGRIKQNLEEANKELQFENNNVNLANKDLQIKIDKSEKERLRMEAEARDSADQLREMAEKVFQLLERLKLSELGKTKAMEALKKKELDMVALQKKNARLIKESTEEGRARVKAELDVKVLQDQVRTLKKHNTQVTQKSKEEATDKVKAQEECEQLREKITVTESRLSFLLNKVQADEEARVIQAEDRKKLEAQVLTLTSKCEELQHKLAEMGESNRIITQAMRLKQEELNDVSMKYEALVKENERRDANEDRGDSQQFLDMSGARIGAPDDIDNVRLNEGRGRFYVEVKSVGGGSMLLLRGRKPLYREWLERQGVNDFLKKAQKTTRFRDMIVEKMGSMYGLLMVEEEEKGLIVEQVVTRDKQIDHLQKKLSYIQDGLAAEEDAKRRMLLRYIHAVKEHAQNATDGIGGVLQLPESNISDEEIHALAALLRNNTSIEELNLRGNNITDDGARALAAVLSGKSGLRLVDLRGNKIGKSAIRILAEALERSERVRHVYVHAGGKIEALGTGKWATKTRATIGSTVDDNYSLESSAKQPVNVETICVVDIRDNNPAAATSLLDMDSSLDNVTSTSLIEASQGSSNYTPAVMLESSGAPPRSAHSNKRQQQTSEKTPHQNNSTNKTSPSKMEKKISKTEIRKQQEVALRESAWKGRSGGLDITAPSTDVRIKKKSQRNLPPIGGGVDSDGSMFEDGDNKSPHRARSAPDLIDDMGFHGSDDDEDRERPPTSSQKIIQGIIKKARGQSNVPKAAKLTGVEQRLLNSPFATPVVKDKK